MGEEAHLAKTYNEVNCIADALYLSWWLGHLEGMEYPEACSATTTD